MIEQSWRIGDFTPRAIVPSEDIMALHKYKIGQLVEFLPRSRDSNIPRGQYKIQRQLPSDSGVLQYRVKHAADGHERVVIETQISATTTPMTERASVFERMPPRSGAD